MIMQFLMVFIISSKGGLKEIGLYGLISSIVIPVTSFFLFDGINAVLAEEDLNNNFSKFIGTIVFNSIIATPIIIILSILFDIPVHYTFGFFLFRTVINIKEIIYSYYQRQSAYKYLSFTQLIMAVIVIIVFAVIYYFGFKNLNVFYLCTIAVILTYSVDIYILKVLLDNKIKFLKIDFTFMRQRFKSGVNLGTNSIVTALKVNTPKYFIQLTTQNIELIGVITVYMQIITGLSVINLIYCRLNLGKVGNLLRDKFKTAKQKIYKIILNNYILITVFSLGLLVFIGFAINLVFGNEYINDLNIFRLMLMIKLVAFPLVIFKVICIRLKIEYILTRFTIITFLLLMALIFFTNELLYFMIFYLSIEFTMMILIFYITNKRLTSFFKSKIV